MSAEDLLAAIRAEPEADEPRQVYADWLIQRGDPRGEFINLQIARAQAPADEPEERSRERYERERELFEAHSDAWLADVGLTPAQSEHGTYFRRGFVDYVTFMHDELPDLAKLAREPLRAIWLRKARPDSVAALLESGCAERVADLSIWADETPMRFDVLPQIAARAPLPRLQALDLAYCDTGGADAFIASGIPHQLGELQLRHMDWQDDALVPIVDALDQITKFQISHNPPVDRSLERLAPRMPQLTALRIDGVVVAPPVLARLLAATRVLDTLVAELVFADRETAQILTALAAAGPDALQALELKGSWEIEPTRAHREVVVALGEVLARAGKLVELELDYAHLGDFGGDAIARCASQLETLHLNHCELGVAGVRTIFENNPRMLALESLSLSHNPLADGAARLLARTPFTKLRHLELDGTDIGLAGAQLLAESQAFGNLARLYCSAGMAEPLRARFGEVVKPI